MSEGSGRELRYNVGDIVASRFRITKPLGSSEGGDAYLVEETERNRRMVLKHLAIPYVGDESYEALRAEIKEASLIRHKNLLQVYGLGKEQQDLFLAMEYVDGETLDKHLQGRRAKDQVMGLKAAYNVVAHICNALQVIHDAGTVHGALTSRNLYITANGRVKIANLVYAKLVSKHLAAEHRGAYFDSPFIAPEALRGDNELTPASDIYSLGLITAELLSNSRLEEHNGSAEQFIEDVVHGQSSALQELLFNAIIEAPHLRQKSVKEFKAGLKDAVDAPSDNELSSVVFGINDLREMAIEEQEPEPERKRDIFDLPDLPPPPSADGIEGLVIADTGLGGLEDEEIWLVQREGLDYGPFTKDVVVAMLHKDEVSEATSVLNMVTQVRKDLIDIPEFRTIVEIYIPVRDARRAREQAERERKIDQVKAGAKVSAAGVIAGGAVIIALSVIAYMQLPDPVPIEFSAGISDFPYTFEVPKIEEMALNVDTSQALAIFDPQASEAEREAALAQWAEEHRKRIAEKRKTRPRRRRPHKGPGATGGEDDIDTSSDELSFATGDDGQELEALDDWEVEEKLYSASSFRKQSECFMKYASGRSKKITIDFVIQQSGAVRNVHTTASGELDACLTPIFRSMRFRAFGGTIKKVTYPIEFG